MKMNCSYYQVVFCKNIEGEPCCNGPNKNFNLTIFINATKSNRIVIYSFNTSIPNDKIFVNLDTPFRQSSITKKL